MSETRAILVVDDSPSVRETVAFILESEGCEVHMAANGKEGLKLAAELRPKVVLTDGMMPGMDGFELCRQLKNDPDLVGICVIMLTSMGQKIDRERAQTVVVNHFATKPFDEDEMLPLLEDVFRT